MESCVKNGGKNMTELINTTRIVKDLLESNEQCRNSDSSLYLNVLQVVGSERGICPNNMTVEYFWNNRSVMGFPPPESVRRARQKLQRAHPELRACEKVEQYRAENEKEYRAYAGSDIP